MLPRVAEIKALADLAESKYRPLPCAGDATLFLAETRSLRRCSPRDVWTHYVTGRLEVLPVTGEHGRVLSQDRNLEVLGSWLSRCLADADDNSAAVS